MDAPHPEPRPEPRQRVHGTPQVDIAHAAAAGQLVITVHVDVPNGYVQPSGIRAAIAEAVKEIALPARAAEATAVARKESEE